jgi:hypothetical protein
MYFLLEERKKIQTWYSQALKLLSPLRYHVNELIEEIESYNRFAEKMGYPPLAEKKVLAAKRARDRAEKFFTQHS